MIDATEKVNYRVLANWDVQLPHHGNTASHESLQTAVLYSIRDELRKLNRLIGCTNFLAIPHTLRAIRNAVEKPKPKRKRPVKKKEPRASFVGIPRTLVKKKVRR